MYKVAVIIMLKYTTINIKYFKFVKRPINLKNIRKRCGYISIPQ